ncbi:MAG: hypothetical protein NZ519_01435 [Bacteroidia bacterium]|nr:hypothetical protein [Bacteroidia bacterium]
MGVSLRSCPQGRRASGYVRNAPTLALARGTPKKIIIKLSLLSFKLKYYSFGYVAKGTKVWLATLPAFHK